MKRLIAYLFIVLGLGLSFNVNASVDFIYQWQTIVKNGPKVFLFSLLTGLIAWYISKITLKEFEKKSRDEGFENGHYKFDDDNLR